FQAWIFTFGAIGAVIGMFLAQILKGSFDLAGMLGALTAALILVTIDLIRKLRKKDQTPEFDERTRNNMLKFYAYAGNGFILLSILICSILLITGTSYLSLTYLLLILFLYFSLSGTIAFIISCK